MYSVTHDSTVVLPTPADVRHEVLGTLVSCVNIDEAISTIDAWIQDGQRQYVCVANVHLVVEGCRDPKLRGILSDSGMTVPDGAPLAWILKWSGRRETGRVRGPDLLPRVCAHSVPRGYSHYFYGGTETVVEDLIRRLRCVSPGLKVAGACTPPFRDLSPEEDAAAVREINDANPDIVWVALGAPKQERWMATHRAALSAPVLVGVGAAFDFLSGHKREAPLWMQQIGMEWLFRLCSEPSRLWRRYLVTNLVFLAAVSWRLMRSFPPTLYRMLQKSA